MTALGLLVLLLTTIVLRGYTAFVQTTIGLDIAFDKSVIDPDGVRSPEALARANYAELVNNGLYERFPDVQERRDRRALRGLLSTGAPLQLRQMVVDDPALIGTTREVWLLASDDVDQLVKGNISRDVPEANRRIKDSEISWIDALEQQGGVETQFNRWLFTNGNSREPELAGIWGAVVGSFYLMLVTVLISLPIGVCSAIYLEEFAPKNNRWVDLIEVNVNNLAAVPSIVFGLLGLAVFLQLFGLPRSSPLVERPSQLADLTHDRGCDARCLALGSTLDPRRRARHRGLANSGRDASRVAAGAARRPYRRHHRHGPRARVRPRRC